MKLSKSLFIILIMFSFLSCSNKQEVISTYFAKANQYKPILNEIKIENLLIGHPTQMLLIDSFLILKDKHGSHEFSLISLNDRKLLTRFGEYGAGPNEIMVPMNMNYRKDENVLEFIIFNPFRIAQINTKDFENFNRQSDINIIKKNPNFEKTHLNNLLWDSKSQKYIGCGAFENYKYISFDSLYNNVNYWGEYPKFKTFENIENYLLGDIFQGKLISRPDGKKIIHIHSSCDLINIISDNQIINNFQTYNPEVKELNGMAAINQDTPYGYIDGVTSNKYIYLLYSGRNFREYSLAAEVSEHLYVFDWELNPVSYYHLDKPSTSLTMSEDCSKLYLTCLDDYEMKIYQMDINEQE